MTATPAAAPRDARACPACGTTSSATVGEKNGYVLQRCRACAALFAPTGGVDDEIRDMYDHYYDGARFDLPPAAELSLRRLVDSCAPYRRSGRWLDVGYGEGGLLSIVQSEGWSCYGVETSPAALTFGRQRGWTVTDEPAGNASFAAGSFDVVTMVEFLEHVPTPQRFLKQAATWLRPGGLLHVTTPNVESLNYRVLGLRWSVVSPPEHVVLWTRRGLCQALSASDFRVIRARTEGFNPSEIFARLRAGVDAAEPDRNQAGFALSAALSRSAPRRCLKRSANALLHAFRVGDTLKIWAVRHPAP